MIIAARSVSPGATALRGDLRDPQAILTHTQVRQLIDFDQPVGILLVAVLHFIPDDAVAYDVVSRLVSAAVPGSYLVVSHASADEQDLNQEIVGSAQNLYRQRTATPSICAHDGAPLGRAWHDPCRRQR